MYDFDEELDAVLTFQTQVGQRRHGHYDHDSHRGTGPMTSFKPKKSKSVVTTPSQHASSPGPIKLKRLDTGEILRA